MSSGEANGALGGGRVVIALTTGARTPHVLRFRRVAPRCRSAELSAAGRSETRDHSCCQRTDGAGRAEPSPPPAGEQRQNQPHNNVHTADPADPLSVDCQDSHGLLSEYETLLQQHGQLPGCDTEVDSVPSPTLACQVLLGEADIPLQEERVIDSQNTDTEANTAAHQPEPFCQAVSPLRSARSPIARADRLLSSAAHSPASVVSLGDEECTCEMPDCEPERSQRQHAVNVQILPADPHWVCEQPEMPASKASVAIQRLISSAVPPISADLVRPEIYIRASSPQRAGGDGSSVADSEQPPQTPNQGRVVLRRCGSRVVSEGTRRAGGMGLVAPCLDVRLDETMAAEHRPWSGHDTPDSGIAGDDEQAVPPWTITRICTEDGDIWNAGDPASIATEEGETGQRVITVQRQEGSDAWQPPVRSGCFAPVGERLASYSTVASNRRDRRVKTRSHRTRPGIASHSAEVSADGAPYGPESAQKLGAPTAELIADVNVPDNARSAERAPCSRFQKVAIGLSDLGPELLAPTRKYHLWRQRGGTLQMRDVCGCLNLSYSRAIAENGHYGYACNLCNKWFSLHSSVRRHHRMVHDNERRYTCAECGVHYFQLSDLKRHLLASHTQLKPYRCQHCNACFSRPADFKKHVRSHL